MVLSRVARWCVMFSMVALGVGCMSPDGPADSAASGGRSSGGRGGGQGGSGGVRSDGGSPGGAAGATSGSALGGAGGSASGGAAGDGSGGRSASGGRGATTDGGVSAGRTGTSPTGGVTADAGPATGGRATQTGGAAGGGGLARGTGGAVGGSGGSGTVTSSAGGSGGSSTGGSGGGAQAACTFTVSSSISSKMATVGIVEWSTSLPDLASARIAYTLSNAGANVRNKGGIAPVDTSKAGYRTLLLGLKQGSDYTFQIEATSSSGDVCKSSSYPLPKTGTFPSAPAITRTAGTASAAQADGFVTTSTGVGMGIGGGGASSAFIIDGDGAVVWYSAAPTQCSRARIDYEGVNMWMMALNVTNGSGEMRYLSLDGQNGQNNVSGLSGAHHDFTVLPGKVAALVWASTGTDPESNLVERNSDGSGAATTLFKVGSNLYAGGQSLLGGGGNAYHCNSVLYHAADQTYTIGDRNPNLYVKVKRDGTPVWQLGGSCTNAKAAKCAQGSWAVNHGHDFDENGNVLIFNNGQSGAARVLELKISEAASSMTFSSVKEFSSSTSSNTLGDVQRLPNGNTLITYSNAGQILEVDASWATVQTLVSGARSFGYSEWRESLYGPPDR